MSFKEVASLDAERTVALGKKDKATGKPYPKTAEGYYLGSRTVENKRGESKIHFLSTSDGNLGLWGTTDLNRKIVNVKPGTMVRVTSTGTKPTPNGEMYTYKVEVDADNTIEVDTPAETPTYQASEDEVTQTIGNTYIQDEESDEDTEASAAILAAERAAKAAKVQAIMNRGKTK